ncbi:MAG: TolC family protein [Rhodospirillaceae bacterium]
MIGKEEMLIISLIRLAIYAFIVFAPSQTFAESYLRSLERLLSEHARIAGSRADLEGAKDGASKARSAWYPDLNITGSTGNQWIEKNNGDASSAMHTRELTLGLRQPLWDFGAINASIDKADIGVKQSDSTFEMAKQDLLFEGISAYINLERAYRSLTYAEQSVENIRKQTGMEVSKVEMGGGFTSDVLQAKSQLAGGQAREARGRGLVSNATNRFRAVFARDPLVDDRDQHIVIPIDLLPHSIEEAVNLGRKRNRQLESAQLATEVAKKEVERVRAAELAPDIHAVAQRKYERNPDGLAADRLQHIVKIEMTYRFNTGLGSFYSISGAQKGLVSAESRYQDQQTLIEEQVRNAWQNYESAKENAGHLRNQAAIAAEFLRLAREERMQGRRSLIDVLSGETSLINSQSDAVSAEADVAVAAFTLLRATGLLGLDILK